MRLKKLPKSLCLGLIIVVITVGFVVFMRNELPGKDIRIDNQKLTLDQVKFAAKKLTKNTRILHVTPLVLPNGEIIAYEIVFCKKDFINYTDFEPFIKEREKFIQLAEKAQSITEIYEILIKSRVTDFNAPIFSDYFLTLVMSNSRDRSPEEGRYDGLPMTYKLRSIAEMKLKKINPRARIINGKYSCYIPPWIFYYFETNSGDKYLLSPAREKIIQVTSLQDIEIRRHHSTEREIKKQEEWKIKARKKWDELLEGYRESNN